MEIISYINPTIQIKKLNGKNFRSMSMKSLLPLGQFTLWGEFEKQLGKDKENSKNLEYTIDLLNYITKKIYKNHKYYWKLQPEEKKYFLRKITKSIINGCYEENVKGWNEKTFRMSTTTHIHTNKRKRKRSDQENQEPVQPEILTDTDISKDLETIREDTSPKKVRLNSSEET